MPTITFSSEQFFLLLGQRLSTEQFDKLCFDFGLEFDGEEKDDDGVVQYRVEVPANRVDLSSAEGLSQALGIFLETARLPDFSLLPLVATTTINVSAATAAIRPFCYAAILRGIVFTPANYKSFIDLQDKLHQNIARRRQLVAIGTHDLSTVREPFTYDAENPANIVFVPLNQALDVNGLEMMDLLSSHTQLKAYLPIIRDSPVYPVIRDANGVVLSVPPIINGEHSKITLATEDVFVEVTATDQTKGQIVLNTVVSLFSRYCCNQFTVEPVRVVYAASHPLLPGKTFINPMFKPTCLNASVKYISAVTGIPDLKPVDVCRMLARMMIQACPDSDNPDLICAQCPIVRSDVLHQCDLAEDVAVAYGFNNIKYNAFSSAREQDYMSLSNYIRTELAQCGYHEALTWGLCSIKESFEFLRRKWRTDASPLDASEYDPTRKPVHLSNPKTREFEIVRTSLLPGLLKTVTANKAQELPLRIFEIGDCVWLDPSTESRCRTVRYCAALIANNSGSGLEAVHGLLDVILAKLELVPDYKDLQGAQSRHMRCTNEERIYKLEITDDDEAFLPGRCVRIVVEPGHKQLGVMGVLHPLVLKAYNIGIPCSIFEFSLQPFLEWMPETAS